MSKETAGVVLAKTVESTASNVNNVVQSVAHSDTVKSLDAALAELVTQSVAGVKEGFSFVAGQIPDVVMQLVVYQRVLSTAYFVFGVILLLLAYKAVKAGFEESKKPSREQSDGVMVFSIVGGLVSIFGGALFTILNVATMIKVWFAPKVWLIEYAVDLTKKVTA